MGDQEDSERDKGSGEERREHEQSALFAINKEKKSPSRKLTGID
ncbi:hypothetical protein [Vibrio vulnificus YJ016]|uniref:Uncharacterized protein n=1 Tax=Vibrio vulnificus (strain YJ016) TaxID=196600 RepID=Q7MP75_VIBVY|nr:hypothetical protein [Vibrio vulnificus YJ016]